MNDAATTAGPTNWKKGALMLFFALAVLATLAALLLPKKQATDRNAPTEHRQHAPGYSHPAQ